LGRQEFTCGRGRENQERTQAHIREGIDLHALKLTE
jgi:hypothetical protein